METSLLCNSYHQVRVVMKARWRQRQPANFEGQGLPSIRSAMWASWPRLCSRKDVLLSLSETVQKVLNLRQRLRLCCNNAFKRGYDETGSIFYKISFRRERGGASARHCEEAASPLKARGAQGRILALDQEQILARWERPGRVPEVLVSPRFVAIVQLGKF